MNDADIKIPMLDLGPQHAALEEELLQGFAAVLASGRFVLGDPVEAFESDLAKLCDIRHALGCNSGTDAIWLALRGLGIGPGDAVLCPAYSFFATAATIVRVGARPIFVDIDPTSLNMDPADAVRRAAGVENLRAVISVDLFGRVCELGPLEAYCRERSIPIIQDAAQSIGALDLEGSKVGARATAACFSFYPTKNLGALGDGGALVTAHAALARRVAQLRVHGESEPGVYSEIGINSRLDSLQAVALSIKLAHLDRWIQERRRWASHYDALFAERGASPGSARLGDGSLPLQTPDPGAGRTRHTYHRYVVRVAEDRRAGLIDALRQEGIASEVYYSRGLHQQPALLAHVPTEPLPETERASRETLALPLFPELGLDRLERVVGTVSRHLAR